MKRKKYLKLLSSVLSAAVITTMLPAQMYGIGAVHAQENTAAEKTNKSIPDGVSDNWEQDELTVKGGEICAVEDGWLHLKAVAENGNGTTQGSYPAVFTTDNNYNFAEDGYFEFVLKSHQSSENNRFGIYLGYENPGHGMFIGYDNSGWFWQKYGAPDNPWMQGERVKAPTADTEVKVRVEWTKDQKVTLKLDDEEVFTEEFSSIENLGDKIALKAATYGNQITDVYLKEIHYMGQETVKPDPEPEPEPAEEYVVKTENGYDILSPDEKLRTSIYVNEEGTLSYQIERDGQVYLPESDLGMTIDGEAYGENPEIVSAEDVVLYDRTYDLMGKAKTGRDYCVSADIHLNGENDTPYILKVRSYPDGTAFSYDFSEVEGGTHSVTENTQFMVPKGSTTWAGVDREHYGNYESLVEKMNPEEKVAGNDGSQAGINMGMAVEFPEEKGFVGILEGAANTSYVGSALTAEGDCSYRIQTNWSTSKNSVSIDGGFTTPWRIVSVAEDLNELVNNNIVYSVNGEKSETLFADQAEWVIPGRSAWSWLNGGVKNVTPENMRHYTELAAKLGFEYNTIDEGWVFWNGGDKNNYDKELYKNKLASVAEYGEEYGVRQFLWSCINNMTGNMPGMSDITEVNEFLDLMQETGMAGGKIDFWPNESSTNALKLYRQTLENTAKRKLLINFHGSMKPTGWEAAYPNEVTREGIRGYEQVNYDENSRGMEFAPYTYYTTQPFTRFLQGHADFTPHARSAGEIGVLVFGDSPVNMISTDPADLLENEAVEMIKSIPTIWDQTYVLPQSKIGELTMYAREKDGTWFVAGAADQKSQDVTIDFSEFLGDGEYLMELWKDTSVMDSNGNGGSKEKTVDTISAEDKMELSVIEHGGFVMRLTKLQFSQYGGEIKENHSLTITTPSKDSVVKVTLDGSDPKTSNTAVVYREPIELTESCQVRAAIVEGDGEGTSVSHRFNKIVSGKTERANLQDILNDAKACQEERYTQETYEALKVQMAHAEELLKKEDASIEELQDAFEKLSAAYQALEEATMDGIYRPDYVVEQEMDVKASPLFNGILEGTVETAQYPVEIAFRARDNENFCRVQFDGDDWKLVQKVNGEEKEFFNRIEDQNRGVDQKTKIRLVYNETRVEVYVDSKIAAVFEDDAIYVGAGTYGIFAEGGKASLSKIQYYDYRYFQTDMADGKDYDIPLEYTATAGNEQGSEPASRVLDGNPSTLWHTSWGGAPREDMYIIFDLKGTKEVAGLRYLPRSSGGKNGIITKYAVELSNDGGKTYERVAEGYWGDDSSWKKAMFDEREATHVKLVSLESVVDDTKGVEYTSAAEIRVTQKRKQSASDDTYDIPVSEMKVTAGSAQGSEGIDRAFDGDVSTLWHSSWDGAKREELWVRFELQDGQKVDGLRYLPRQSGKNGLVTKYKVQISMDDKTYVDVAEGEWASDTAWKLASFEPVEAKYVKFLIMDAGTDSSGKLFGSAAELRLTAPEEEVEPQPQETDKSALQALITYATAQTEKDDYDKVVPAVRKALERELAEATAVNENAEASQAEINSAYEELLAIVQMLEFKGDATNLRLAVTLAKAIDTEGKTEESVAALNAAITAAEEVLANENALQEEIDKALKDLNEAVAGLEDKPSATVNKEKLKELLEDSKKYEERIDEYTAATANAFLAALTGAREIYENPDATQEEVNQAYVTLRQAIFGLREIPSKEKLEELMKEAEKIDLGKYTEESAQAVRVALSQAKAVKDNQNATIEDVKEAEEMLRTAINGLQAKAGTETTPDKVQNQSDSDGNSGKTDTKSAKTGDDVPVMLWMTAVAAAVMLIFRKKNR